MFYTLAQVAAECRTRPQMLARVFMNALRMDDVRRLELCQRLHRTLSPAEQFETRARILDEGYGVGDRLECAL